MTTAELLSKAKLVPSSRYLITPPGLWKECDIEALAERNTPESDDGDAPWLP